MSEVIMRTTFKTFDELKAELGDNFERAIYDINVELLTEKHSLYNYVKLVLADMDRKKERMTTRGVLEYILNQLEGLE